jgi:ATPase subunit of ABC transporter with duplicated ATPase domains
LVTIRHLKKNYDRFPVLRGLHMNIEKGDVYGFLGRNGCGKTTTMNIIANVIQKDMHLWHLQTLHNILHMACANPRCTAMVAAIITAIAISSIIMLQLPLQESR